MNLIIKYNVSNAGWFPIYDLRADKINAPLDLAYKAHVYQNTGSTWENVKLTLSTSDPNTNNMKPEVTPKYLNFVSLHSPYQNQRATKAYNYKYNPMVKTVSGIVVDAAGQPLPGVNVIENGTSNGTQTDFDGRYSLSINHGSELNYSYVGMMAETLPIHSSIMNVSLNEDSTHLDEVVVTAMGIKRNKEMGYSTSSITSESIESALQGRAAGLIIEGDKSSNAFIKIRGINSLKSNSTPLYIIDGIPVEARIFNQLNPDNVAHVEILNHSSASGIYGHRALNGVVVIQTKKELTSNGDVIEQGITNTRFEIKSPTLFPLMETSR